MSMRSAFALVTVLLAAGCVLPAAEDALPAGAWALPFPDPMMAGDGHDHRDLASHANAYNFELLDHHPLAGGPSHAAGAHALDLKGGYLFAAVYGGDAGAEGGFFIFDASDPTKLAPVGRYQFPGQLGGDRSLEATEDAEFVVLGTEVLTCAGHVNPFAPGLYLIDVRDKANPVPVDYRAATGVHAVTIHRIGGDDYVFAVMGDQNVFRIDRSLPKPTLVPVAELPIGHDSVVLDDPVLGIPILYASNGGAGFEMWDVSDPAAPQQLAAWNIPDRDDKYYIHTGAVQFIDGKRVVVVTSEDWEDYPSAMWVLDATELDLIEVVGTWENPGTHAADGLRFSMHNPRFHGTTLVLAHYHGGLWALDLGTRAAQENPVVVGQYMTTQDIGWKGGRPTTAFVSDSLCGLFHLGDTPLVFDVESGDGVVYVADIATGLYVLRPTW